MPPQVRAGIRVTILKSDFALPGSHKILGLMKNKMEGGGLHSLHTMHAARDFAILTLSFSTVHIGLNELPLAHTCPYDGAAGLLFSLFTFLMFSFAKPGVARDVAGIVPGIWFQITVKPEGYFASVAVEGCDMRSSGYAMAMWVLGEILTFGAAVRLLPKVKRKPLPVILTVIGAASMVWGVDVVAKELSKSL